MTGIKYNKRKNEFSFHWKLIWNWYNSYIHKFNWESDLALLGTNGQAYYCVNNSYKNQFYAHQIEILNSVTYSPETNYRITSQTKPTDNRNQKLDDVR